MDFTASQWLQLNGAAALGILAFITLYMAPVRWAVTALFVIAPFAIIPSRYGPLNVYLIYLVGLVLVLRGQIRSLPYSGFVAFIAFAYALSLSQVPPVTITDHALYLLFIGSNFISFYVAYNYFITGGAHREFLNLLLVVNGLVLAYSLIQLVVGANPNSFIYSSSFGLSIGRLDEGRLTGPFGVVGLTAEYFVMAFFVCGFILLRERRGSLVWTASLLMLFGNLAAMVATANRGAIVSLVGAGAFFLYLFRRRLGARGILVAVSLSSFAFFSAATLVINFSDFNLLFERLSGTQMEEGLPDTRADYWPKTWEAIQERPLFGHGPQFTLSEDTYKQLGSEKQLSLPHNLYLFLGYTVGIIGLVAYLIFFARLYWTHYRGSRATEGSMVSDGLPQLAMVLMAIFFIDQMKVEFLRVQGLQFQHVIFLLFGGLAALSMRSKSAAVTDAPPALLR